MRGFRPAGAITNFGGSVRNPLQLVKISNALYKGINAWMSSRTKLLPNRLPLL
jgi:hypothetical protein